MGVSDGEGFGDGFLHRFRRINGVLIDSSNDRSMGLAHEAI
jgi:hypothetical protein